MVADPNNDPMKYIGSKHEQHIDEVLSDDGGYHVANRDLTRNEQVIGLQCLVCKERIQSTPLILERDDGMTRCTSYAHNQCYRLGKAIRHQKPYSN